MFAKLLIVPLFIATSAVAHPTINRRGDVSLADWQSQSLESYWSFKQRYRDLGCSTVPGTDFYTTCCYPLGASESLSSRPAECTPSHCSAPSASVSSTPTINVASVSVESVPTPSATDDEEDDSNLPFCEEGQSEYDDGTDDVASVYVAPAYTTPANTPAASSDNQTPSSSQAQSTPTPTQNTGSGNGEVNTGGFATYFYQNGNAGACGQYHSDSDLIAAIDQERYGYDFSQASSLCGKQVFIKNPANGNTVTVTITDVCPTCDNGNSIDLSVGAFEALAALSVGHMAIEWSFV